MSFEALFHPRSVAVIGASSNPQKIGGLPVRMLRELGFTGDILPVNPTASEIQGLRAWPSVRELPKAPDVAIVAVPAASVVASIRDCTRRGVRAAVVFSSGFAEGGAAGLEMQHEIARIASEGGLTLLGPNCLGVMNVRRRWIGTFSPAPLSGLPAAGSVAIVSQSGAFGAYAFVLARKAGLGLSQWITTGNEAGVSVADVIDWLADDDETRVIVAYIEGARDGDRLRRALLKARAAGKPVVVTKVGRTEVGARAAMSHTASLSGEDAVYQAVFDETGAVRAFTVEQMFRLAHAFSLAPPPRGRRLGIITVSGGVGTLMADAASDAGLELPPLPPRTRRQLRERVPFASTDNPVDVTGQITADYETLNITALGAAQSGAFDALCLFLAAASAAPVIGPRVVDTMQPPARCRAGVATRVGRHHECAADGRAACGRMPGLRGADACDRCVRGVAALGSRRVPTRHWMQAALPEARRRTRHAQRGRGVRVPAAKPALPPHRTASCRVPTKRWPPGASSALAQSCSRSSRATSCTKATLAALQSDPPMKRGAWRSCADHGCRAQHAPARAHRRHAGRAEAETRA